MPYIRKEAREILLSLTNQIESTQVLDSGELNYIITTLLINYVEKKGLNYAAINDAVGALECSKMELYRRIAIPLENRKIKENGDVY